MAKKEKSPLTISQTDDVWYCAVRKLRTFVQEDETGETFFRPSLLAVVSLKSGALLMVEVIKPPIAIQELYEKLAAVMIKPPKSSSITPQRPAEIHFEDQALVEAIQPLLAEVQITAQFQPQREGMDQLVQDMEKSVFGEENDQITGLLKQRGVKPELVGSLFAAALEFYRAEPWVQLSNFDILSVQLKGQKSPYFVIVMGQGGEEYGLSVYRNWQEVESMFRAAHPMDALPRQGRHAFSFNEPPFVSLDDLDAIETYGWELPAPDMVPTPSVYMQEGIKRPDAAMLRWYEAVLRAIPAFVSDHLQTEPDGSHPPVEADLEVKTQAGTIQVHIRLPGGDIYALQNQMRDFDLLDDADESEELDSFLLDRRGMEGMLAQLSAQMGAEPRNSDPTLQKAQKVMYDAWEEGSPTKRIALAKKALKMSPDCADAYVLLAEEEAQTARQAMEYYQAGVDAGRRALGEDFLEDPNNIGFFWGILETRPYMRAMQGLGAAQWQTGQREEAVRTYQELLRLNPGDNQGIRYLLLQLFVDLGWDEQARDLLKQYKEDWSADMAYTDALLAFREKGDSPKAKTALKRAMQINEHVLPYLAGEKRIPSQRSDMITLGGVDEAVNYASSYLNYWRKTPGAVEWLLANSKKRKQG